MLSQAKEVKGAANKGIGRVDVLKKDLQENSKSMESTTMALNIAMILIQFYLLLDALLTQKHLIWMLLELK